MVVLTLILFFLGGGDIGEGSINGNMETNIKYKWLSGCINFVYSEERR